MSIGIGSGGQFALAAALALINEPLDTEEIVKRSMKIAADICVYSNHNLVVEVISESKTNPPIVEATFTEPSKSNTEK